jgi:DNA primase
MDENEELVELLEDILGDRGLHYPNRGQISFNCPKCDDGRNKHNLEVNYFSNVFKCWSCGDSDNTHGALGKLIDIYGNRKQKKLFNILKPETVQVKEVKKPKLRLPKEYKEFKEVSPIYPVRKQAKKYLDNRGITDYMIEKYQIGFCDSGDHAGRIIIPSYDKKGELNYYISRSWDTKSRYKYKNPQAEKDKIIFWENHIDWGKDIYLVEGVFDGLFLPNSIPMLGKHMSTVLFENIYNKSKGDIIICLDADAWENAKKLYHELNGGELYGRIKIIKLVDDKDVCDLKGQIDEFYYQMRN